MTKTKVELTPRELQVVVLIGKALKYKDIAAELQVEFETVKTHVSRIRKKLGVNSKVAVVLWAQKEGLIK